MSKLTKKILIINGVVIISLLLIGGWFWYAQSQMYVKMGFAQDKFPYRVYTLQEMASMYSQEPLEN